MAAKLAGLWSPFVVEAGADTPAGRRMEALLWDGGSLSGDTLPADASGKTPLERGLLDATNGFTLPGLVCAHVEPVLSLFAGFPSKKDESAADRAWRIGEALERDDVGAAALACAADAALAGVTTVYALHRAPVYEGVLDTIADAFRAVGVRVVAAVAADEAHGGAGAARAATRENVRFASACAERADGMAAAMAGIADSRAIPTTLLETVGDARRAELSCHVVLTDPPDARRSLAEKAALRPGSVAVIAAPLDDEERALLRDLEVVPATTPRADTARGVPPPSLRGLSRRAVFGGRDGIADVLAERDAYLARAATQPESDRIPWWRGLSNGWDLAATTFDLPFGRFVEGSPADLAVFDAAAPGEVTPASLPAHVELLGARHVRHVVVAGRVLVREGELVSASNDASDRRKAASAAWRRVGKKA